MKILASNVPSFTLKFELSVVDQVILIGKLGVIVFEQPLKNETRNLLCKQFSFQVYKEVFVDGLVLQEEAVEVAQDLNAYVLHR